MCPMDTPPGSYQVGIGAYHKDSGERLPILSGDQPVADRIILNQVQDYSMMRLNEVLAHRWFGVMLFLAFILAVGAAH